jgi:hypothetical protein
MWKSVELAKIQKLITTKISQIIITAITPKINSQRVKVIKKTTNHKIKHKSIKMMKNCHKHHKPTTKIIY